MIERKGIINQNERAGGCDAALHVLPNWFNWFGKKESTADDIKRTRELPSYAAFRFLLLIGDYKFMN